MPRRVVTLIPNGGPSSRQVKNEDARALDVEWLYEQAQSYGLHCSEAARLKQRNEANDAESAGYRDKAATETLERIRWALFGQPRTTPTGMTKADSGWN